MNAAEKVPSQSESLFMTIPSFSFLCPPSTSMSLAQHVCLINRLMGGFLYKIFTYGNCKQNCLPIKWDLHKNWIVSHNNRTPAVLWMTKCSGGIKNAIRHTNCIKLLIQIACTLGKTFKFGSNCICCYLDGNVLGHSKMIEFESTHPTDRYSSIFISYLRIKKNNN